MTKGVLEGALLPHSVNRLLTGLFLTLVLALVGLIYQGVTQGVRIESDLKKLFPEDPAHALENQVNSHLFDAFGNTLVVGVSAANKTELRQAMMIVRDALSKQQLIQPVAINDQLQQQQAQQALLADHRYFLLTTEQRTAITQGDHEKLHSDAARGLFAFRTSGLSPIEDPFNWLAPNFRSLALPIAGELDGTDLVIHAGDEVLGLQLLKLESGAFSMAVQDEVAAWLAGLRLSLTETLGDRVQLHLSGAVFHAAEASQSARREMSVIGTGSIIGIVVLFLLAFRQLRPLLLTLTSVGFGCALAFFLTLFLFGNVHLITLVFGASLIGVAVDYSLHYLCKQQAAYLAEPTVNNAANVRAFLLPALALSLLTSVLGYSCLLQTPLVGLQQIASFSITGLVGAWLFVMVLYPFIAPQVFKPEAKIVDSVAQFFWSVLGNAKPVVKKSLLLVAVVVVLLGALTLSISRDVRTLYKPSPELMASEQYLQSALQSVSPNQYFLIKAPSPELLLQREERFIRESLNPLISNNALAGVVATSNWVSSQQQQLENYQAQHSYLYGDDKRVMSLFEQVGFEEGVAQSAQALFDSKQSQPLRVDEWLRVARADQQFLWQGAFLGEYVSIVALRGVRDVAALRALATNDVIFVDRVGDLSLLLLDLIQSAAAMLALAYIAVAILVVVAYRRLRAVTIVWVPLASTLLTLALLSLIGVPVNLFHLFGCYLILGLGIDYAIFSYINGNRDAVARRAIWLAAMTSILSFGLLALSQTPMVQSFGITLALGCMFNLLLAPLVAGLRDNQGFDQ